MAYCVEVPLADYRTLVTASSHDFVVARNALLRGVERVVCASDSKSHNFNPCLSFVHGTS